MGTVNNNESYVEYMERLSFGVEYPDPECFDNDHKVYLSTLADIFNYLFYAKKLSRKFIIELLTMKVSKKDLREINLLTSDVTTDKIPNTYDDWWAGIFEENYIKYRQDGLSVTEAFDKLLTTYTSPIEDPAESLYQQLADRFEEVKLGIDINTRNWRKKDDS